MTVVAGLFGVSSFTTTVDISAWASALSQEARRLITQSVAINSTAFEGEQDGVATFIGSKTETALLELAKQHLGLQSLAETRSNEHVAHIVPFDSAKKYMATVIKMPVSSSSSPGGLGLFVFGKLLFAAADLLAGWLLLRLLRSRGLRVQTVRSLLRNVTGVVGGGDATKLRSSPHKQLEYFPLG